MVISSEINVDDDEKIDMKPYICIVLFFFY